MSDFPSPGSLSVIGVKAIGTAVSRLFASRRPTTVSGFIVSVVVDTVKAMLLRRTPPEIREEILVPAPALADCNAPAAISWIVLASPVKAAPSQGGPRLPFWRAGGPVAMPGVFPTNSCVFGAAAGLDTAGLQVAGSNDMLFAAVAIAKPCGVPPLRAAPRNNRQNAKTSADKIGGSPSFSHLFIVGVEG